MNILHLDTNHPILMDELNALGFKNDEAYTISREALLQRIDRYEGIIIRSRLTIDRLLLDKAKRLRFIGRVGAGLENIDVTYAASRGVAVISASGGNADAVGEHALGMLLSLCHHLHRADRELRQGLWQREANRGHEIGEKTIGIIGYGYTGRAFAKRLSGFGAKVLCHDIVPGLGDAYAEQVPLEMIWEQADVLSLHVPETPQTKGMFNRDFIAAFSKDFWLINTARGNVVVTADLVAALQSGKVLGAGLDVMEYEKRSFEDFFTNAELPEDFAYLMATDRVMLTPHIAGWTVESKEKLARLIVARIKDRYC